MEKITYTKGSEIRLLRENLELSQSALGKIVGVSQQHIDRYEKGFVPPLDKIEKLAKALKVNKWSLMPDGWDMGLPISEVSTIPKVGYVHAGQWNEACQLSEDEWEMVYFPINNNYKKAKIFALGVRGNSMNKVFAADKTTLVCCPIGDYYNLYGEVENGKYVIVYRNSPDGLCEATVKKYNTINDDMILLEPETTETDKFKPFVLQSGKDNSEYQIAAVVISKYEDL